jgi:pyruvate dehydrogenase E1 component alpha subunit
VADGNDAEAVLQATARSVEHARSGKGPVLLVFDTYRWREHCGPNFDNQLGYRTEGEYLEWKKRDPVALLKDKLMANGGLDDKTFKQIEQTLQRKVDAGFEFAKTAPLPDSSEVSKFVYA